MTCSYKENEHQGMNSIGEKKFLVIEVREEPQEMSCRESFFGSVHSKNPLLLQRL